jgi:hypothetical protein
MKLLGVASRPAAFRWDLLYLFSQLETDDRAGIATLAPPVEVAMQTLETRQIAYDEAQKAVIVATALVAKRDKVRDRLIVELGGVARATGREAYLQLFPRYNPSQTTKLGMDLETDEVTRILGELGTLPATHPLRLKYEKPLSDAEADFSAALAQFDAAEVALKLERSQMQRCKVDLDKLRLETHGKLLALLADKAEADAFYRPTLRAADEAAVN